MKKANYIGSSKIDNNYLEMEFEYRGERYFVTRALSWTKCSSDYTLKSGSMTEGKQHKRAQEAIDRELDNPTDNKIEPYNNTNELAFEAFLKYVDGDETAFNNL